MKRREVLTLGAATAVSLAYYNKLAWASPEYRFKYGTSLTSRHPAVVAISEVLEKIKERTSGRLEIQMFSDGQLGTDQDMQSQARSGALEFHLNGTTNLASLQPNVSIVTLPFAFKDHADAWKAVDGKLGRAVVDSVPSRGLHALFPLWPNGFRQITNSKRPIEKPEDIAGLKIRVPASPMNVALFKAFGASPQAIDPGETYVALQTKVIDGAENVLFQIAFFNLHEVQEFYSATHHQWDAIVQTCNPAMWEGLPTDLKTVVEEEFAAGSLRHREEVDAKEKQILDNFAAAGVKINNPELALFADYLKNIGFYKQQKANFDPALWEIMESYTGKLT